MSKVFLLLIIGLLTAFILPNATSASTVETYQDSGYLQTADSILSANTDSLLASPYGVAEEVSGQTSKSNIIPTSKIFTFNLINLLRGLLGMLSLLFIAWVFSADRKAISWRVVGLGLLTQVVLAIAILQVPFIRIFFEYGGKLFVKILDFTNEGTKFLFESMVTGKIEPSLQTFAITILPTIIFFSALTSVLVLLRNHSKGSLGACMVDEQVPQIIRCGKFIGGRKHFPRTDRIPTYD